MRKAWLNVRLLKCGHDTSFPVKWFLFTVNMKSVTTHFLFTAGVNIKKCNRSQVGYFWSCFWILAITYCTFNVKRLMQTLDVLLKISIMYFLHLLAWDCSPSPLRPPQALPAMCCRRWMFAWSARKPAFAPTATWSLPECFAPVTAVERKMPVRYRETHTDGGYSKLHYDEYCTIKNCI